jgi:hypothetical protein
MRTYDAALDRLYGAFSGYPFRRDMPCCIPHCMDQSELDVIGSMPLRKLSSIKMGPFASNLNTTCGEREDFKFVLPRLLELSAKFEFVWPDIDLVFSWLRKEEISTWPAIEQQAVNDFFDAWWKLLLHEKSERVDDAFDALCCSGIDVTRWLTLWREYAPVSLAEWTNYNIGPVWAGTFGNSFTDDAPLVTSLKAFFSEPATATAFERAFHRTESVEEQDVLSLAEHYVRL